MSAHVLLNLLNELGKRDQMRGLLLVLSLFRHIIHSLTFYIELSSKYFGVWLKFALLKDN